MPSSSGGSPFRLRSRLEPLAPRPSSPRPAPPAPASPGRGPFFWQAPALRRPGGGSVGAARGRAARGPAAAEGHDVCLPRAGPRRAEGEAPPVGGPRRRHVDSPVIGEPPEGLAAPVEEEDVGVATLL